MDIAGKGELLFGAMCIWLRHLIARDDLAEATRLVDRSREEAPDAAVAAAAKTKPAKSASRSTSALIGQYYDGLALDVVVLRYAAVLYANHLVDSMSKLQAAGGAGIGGGGSSSSGGGLDSAAIAWLPCFVLPSRRGGSAAAECAVCLGADEEGEMVCALPCCPHALHARCVDAWLRLRPTCRCRRGRRARRRRKGKDGSTTAGLSASSLSAPSPLASPAPSQPEEPPPIRHHRRRRAL
uniref:RING-type domain-containing protein n=1 Tax=Oryza meridionalis TaxID=40149 RepID=A0A0E0EU21_9ORYZ